jgi:hypothetical protein
MSEKGSKLINFVRKLDREDSLLREKRVKSLFADDSESDRDEENSAVASEEEPVSEDEEPVSEDEEPLTERERKEEEEEAEESRKANLEFDKEDEEEGDAEESEVEGEEEDEQGEETSMKRALLNEKITRVSLIGDLFVDVCADIIGTVKKLRKLGANAGNLLLLLNDPDKPNVYLCYVDLLNTILKLRNVEIPATQRRNKRSKAKDGKRVRVTRNFDAELYITARFRTTYVDQFEQFDGYTRFAGLVQQKNTRSSSSFIPAEDVFTDFVVHSVVTCLALHNQVGEMEDIPEDHLEPGARDRPQVQRIAEQFLVDADDLQALFNYAKKAKGFFRDPDVASVPSAAVKSTEISMEDLRRIQNGESSPDEDDYYESGSESAASDEVVEMARANLHLPEERFHYNIYELRRRAINKGYVYYADTEGDIIFRNAYRRLARGDEVSGGASIKNYFSSDEDESQGSSSINLSRRNNLVLSSDEEGEQIDYTDAKAEAAAAEWDDPEMYRLMQTEDYAEEDTIEAIDAANLVITQAQQAIIAPRRAENRRRNAINEAADRDFATLPLTYPSSLFSKPLVPERDSSTQTPPLTEAEKTIQSNNLAVLEKVDKATGIMRGLVELQRLPTDKCPLRLKPWQADAIQVSKQEHGILIFHPTGSGKSFTSLNIVSRIAYNHFSLKSNKSVRCKFIFSVPNALRLQWITNMKMFLPHMPSIIDNIRNIDFAVISHSKIAQISEDEVDDNTYIFIDEPHTTFLESGRDKIILGTFVKKANKHANRTYLMTATPMQNSVLELMSYLQILQKTQKLKPAQIATFEKLNNALLQGNALNNDIAVDIAKLRKMFMCYISFPREIDRIEGNLPRLIEHEPLLCPMVEKDYQAFLEAVQVDISAYTAAKTKEKAKSKAKGKKESTPIDEDYITFSSGIVSDEKTEQAAVIATRRRDTFYHKNFRYSIVGRKIEAVIATLLAHKKFVVERGRRIGFNQPMKVIVYSRFHRDGSEWIFNAIKDYNEDLLDKLKKEEEEKEAKGKGKGKGKGKAPAKKPAANKKAKTGRSKTDRDREPVPPGGLNVVYSDDADTGIAEKVRVFNELNSDIEVAILTAKTAAGIDFKHVTAVFIVEQDFNLGTIKQAIGRARRLGSHTDLPQELQEVHVVQFLSTVPEDTLRESVLPRMDEFQAQEYLGDEELYFLSKQKDTITKTIRSVLSDCSIELTVNDCFRKK